MDIFSLLELFWQVGITEEILKHDTSIDFASIRIITTKIPS